MSWLQNRFEKNFMITSVDYVFNWARKSALWPMTFGLACCAIEMIASSTSRFDIARFGSEVFRPSPRQSDLMIVSGTVSLKMRTWGAPLLMMAPRVPGAWNPMKITVFRGSGRRCMFIAGTRGLERACLGRWQGDNPAGKSGNM